VRALTPREVWQAGSSLGQRRVRIVGLAKIHSGFSGRYAIRFYGSGLLLVDSWIDADGAGPLVGKVNDGDVRFVTIEGEIQTTRQTTVVLGRGEVIWLADPLNERETR
jgi:hypothetical protein